jgi:ubiquinone/menaquinone biosynthesis C-methylase UbiE
MSGSPGRVVREGYDRVARAYLDARPGDGPDVDLLRHVAERIPATGRVLDGGCGAGYPVMEALSREGLALIGLDLSAGQLGLARTRDPGFVLVQGDLGRLPFADATFDGVVSYYAIIHVPRADHPKVFRELFRVIRAGGVALVCLGWKDKPEDADPDSWLGVPMYWSHFDADTNRELLARAGFVVEWSRQVPDPMDHGSHLFAFLRRD